MKMTGDADLLAQGLKSRLAGIHELKDKLILASSVLHSQINCPKKEEIILDWFGTLLSTKYSSCTSQDLELDSVWVGFLSCVSIAEKKSDFVFNADFLLDIVDHVDLSNSTVVEAVIILLRMLPRARLSNRAIVDIISRFWDKISSQEEKNKQVLTSSVLNLLEKILRNDGSTRNLGLGKLFAKMSHDGSLLENKILREIIYSFVFVSLKCYTCFFTQLFKVPVKGVTDSQTDDVMIFHEFLLSGGDICLLLSTMHRLDTWVGLHSNLFRLALHFEGYDQGYISSSPILAPDLPISTPSLVRLERIFKYALPLNLDYKFSQNLTVGQLFSSSIKFFVEKYGMNEAISGILSTVYYHHPLIMDPLVSILTASYLLDITAPHQIFQTILNLVLKLRQLPKLVSRLLLYLRTTEVKQIISWRIEDLNLFGKAISEVPRVQSVEIWKSLLYHISADCIPVLDTDSGKQIWSVSVPLLTTVLEHAHLSDHNLPAPLAVRVKDLIRATLQDVLVKIEDLREDTLYQNLVCSLLELVELISTYRDLEFDTIWEFRDSLIAAALKKKKMLGYSGILIQGVRGNSLHTAQIWKRFHKELLSLGCLDQVFQLIPVEYMGSLNLPESVEDLVESPSYSALVIFSELSNLSDTDRLAPVLQLDLWTDPKNWNSLQSPLGFVVQKLLTKMPASQGNCSSSVGFDKLLQLPVEYIPKVQKLGLNLLCIELLLSGEIKIQLNDLLCRSFEDTDVFRFLSASTFLERIISLEFPSFSFLDVLSGVVAKYSKMMTEISDDFEKFQDGIQHGNFNHLHFFVSLLENLSHPILHVGVVEEKKSVAQKLSLQITKSLCKHVRKEEVLAPTNLLIRASAAIVKSSRSEIGEAEGWNKTMKLIRRILDNALADGGVESLRLVLELMEGGEKWQVLLTEETVQLARNIGLEHCGTVDGSKFISKLLNSSAQVEDTLNYSLSHPASTLLEMANIILATRFSEETKPVVKESMENLIFQVLLEDSIKPNAKLEFVDKLVSATPALVSANVETAALASILAHPSWRTLHCFVVFMNNCPNMAAKQIPLICTAVRSHLHYIETNCDIEENMKICSELHQLVGLARRRKEDWGVVAPYLVADILDTYLLLEDPVVRQNLYTVLQSLLDICESHSHEYLSANISEAANETFKILLQSYKTQHKFTANTT
jgi:hypothetical protein